MAYVPTEKQKLLCGKGGGAGHINRLRALVAAPKKYHAAIEWSWGGATIEEPPYPMCDGSFARVIFDKPDSVIKLTCCHATKLLFERLLSLGASAPVSLPSVIESYGDWAIDDNPLTYAAFRIERAEVGESGPFLAAVEKLRRSAGIDAPGVVPAEAVRFATLLAKHDICGTGTAWKFISEFIAQHGLVMDRLNDTNIRFRQDGSICLVDVVGTTDGG